MWEKILPIILPCLLVAMALGALLMYLWNRWFGARPAGDAEGIASLEAKLGAARDECAECTKARTALEARIQALEGELSGSKAMATELESRVHALSAEREQQASAALTAVAPIVAAAAPAAAVAAATTAAGASWASLAGNIEHDHLEDIHGIGPKLATLLHGLGVHTFKQIALWSEADIDQVDAKLEEFKGRIRRENWVASAKECHWRKYNEALAGYVPGMGKVTPTE